MIRDNFWALFQAPEHDLYITDPVYRGKATPLLAMPGQNDDVGSVLSLWLAYRDKRNQYESLRSDAYAAVPAPSWSSLWAGNDNALMPADSRDDYLDDWYQNSGKLKMWLDYERIDDSTPSALKLHGNDPKLDFARQLLARYGDLNAHPDPINRCDGAYCSRPNIDRTIPQSPDFASGSGAQGDRPVAGGDDAAGRDP